MDDSAEFFDCYQRFQRLEDVFRLGVTELGADGRGRAGREDVGSALAEVAAEAVRLAETALRVGAEGDLWQVVDGATGMWHRLGDLVEKAAATGVGPAEAVGPVRRLAAQLVDLQAAVTAVADQLAELGAHPGDRATDAAVQVAIADLLATGDRVVAGALESGSSVRLDAAVAVLTSTAAAAGRAERDRVRLGGRAG